MEIREIVKAALVYHKAAEELDSVMDRAVADGRFRMTLPDVRHFRDLLDDAWLLGDRAWIKSMKVPKEMPKVIQQKLVEIVTVNK